MQRDEFTLWSLPLASLASWTHTSYTALHSDWVLAQRETQVQQKVSPQVDHSALSQVCLWASRLLGAHESDGSLWGEEIFLLARVFFTLVLLNLRIALPTKYQIVPSFCIQVWIWRSVCRLYIIHMHLEITCYVYGMVNLLWLYAQGYTRFLIKTIMDNMWIMNIINFFKLSSMINTMFTS